MLNSAISMVPWQKIPWHKTKAHTCMCWTALVVWYMIVATCGTDSCLPFKRRRASTRDPPVQVKNVEETPWASFLWDKNEISFSKEFWQNLYITIIYISKTFLSVREKKNLPVHSSLSKRNSLRFSLLWVLSMAAAAIKSTMCGCPESCFDIVISCRIASQATWSAPSSR